MAFKNLFCGTRWKLQFINCYFQCTGNYRCINYNINRMMHKVELPKSYIYKIEQDELVLVTIFLHDGSTVKRKVYVSKSLEKPLCALIEKINRKLEKFDMKGNKIKYGKVDQLLTKPNALLLCDGEPVDADKACSSIFTLKGDLMLRLFDNYYVCLINKPFVKTVTLTKTPVSNIYVYPIKLETFCTEKCDIRWLKNLHENSPNETWIEVGKGLHYLIQENDIGYYLKFECVPKAGDSVGSPYELVIKNKVQPNQCSYYYHKIHNLTQSKVQKNMFRLVSYNVLADYYVQTKEGKKIFSYCPLFALQKDVRFSAILNELIGYKPDLICLQEVEKDVFVSLLRPVLNKEGYDGCLCLKLATLEGVACFYRNTDFKILRTENYIYGAEILENHSLKNILFHLQKKNELFNKIISLKHCLQLLVFQSNVNTDEILIVGNVHLYSNPKANFIRIVQVAATLQLIESMLQELKSSLTTNNVSVILCGDFNSTPCSSIHSYIENSTINETCEDEEIMENYDSTAFNHSLKMERACKEILFTNYTADFQGCLDYIYYERDRLEVEKVYPGADEDELKADTGIPSVSFPSDHIPLLVDFKWKCK